MSRASADASSKTTLDYEAGIVTIVHEGGTRLVPTSNVLWMVPAAKPPKVA